MRYSNRTWLCYGAGMAGRYDPSERFKGVDPSKFASRRMTSQERDKDKQADWMRFAGDIAPLAGGALGAIGGGLLGAAGGPAGIIAGVGGGAGAGYSLGNMAKSGLTSMADSHNSGYEDEEANKRDQRDAMLATLMGLRR